ncbi:pectate lyase-like protein [Tanacetum coccineum]
MPCPHNLRGIGIAELCYLVQRCYAKCKYESDTKGLTQRLPTLRCGFIHVVDNDYTMWKNYAIGGAQRCNHLKSREPIQSRAWCSQIDMSFFAEEAALLIVKLIRPGSTPVQRDKEFLRNKFVTSSGGKKRWTGGEDIVAVANNVYVAGYKTKTTINL